MKRQTLFQVGRLCTRFLLAATLIPTLILYGFPFIQVHENSMRPTLKPGDLLILSRLAYRLREIKIGDILAFHHPSAAAAGNKDLTAAGSPKLTMIKRCALVAGMPLSWRGSRLYIPYLQGYVELEGSICRKLKSLRRIPTGFIFVLGDNARHSLDSRNYGLVSVSAVQGKVLWLPSPFRRSGEAVYPAPIKTSDQLAVASALFCHPSRTALGPHSGCSALSKTSAGTE